MNDPALNNLFNVPEVLSFRDAVAALIVLEDGRYLMQLHDDKPAFFYPIIGDWSAGRSRMARTPRPRCDARSKRRSALMRATRSFLPAWISTSRALAPTAPNLRTENEIRGFGRAGSHRRALT